MSKPIILSKVQWDELKEKLCEDNPRSVMLIRTKMREVLGFIPREYVEWNTEERGSPWSTDIRLDFYNEPKKTMFMIKYSEYLKGSKHGYGTQF